MSLFRNGLLNRFSQLTCLVVPKHLGAFGSRHYQKRSNRDRDSADTSNQEDVDDKVADSEDVSDGGFEYVTPRDADLLVPGRYFPTADVFETTYNGIRFEDLPCVTMIFTRNNVKMGAHSADGKTTYGSKTCGNLHDFRELIKVAKISVRVNGLLGFKHAEKRSTVAAQTTGYALGEDIVRKRVKHVRVELVGHTVSRLPAMKGLQQAGVNIVSISDRTNHSFYTRPRHPKKKCGDWCMGYRPEKQITDFESVFF